MRRAAAVTAMRSTIRFIAIFPHSICQLVACVPTADILRIGAGLTADAFGNVKLLRAVAKGDQAEHVAVRSETAHRSALDFIVSSFDQLPWRVIAAARATAFARLSTSSLVKIFLTCDFTVPGVIASSRAISLLDWPRAINSRMARSRGLSSAAPANVCPGSRPVS